MKTLTQGFIKSFKESRLAAGLNYRHFLDWPKRKVQREGNILPNFLNVKLN